MSGPTLISSFVATRAQIDSSADLNEALSDYQYYLGRAVPILEHNGVAVIATNDSTVRWRDSLGRHSIVAADRGGVLYLFVLPNGRIKALQAGVELDGALLAAARDHFHLRIPVPRIDSLWAEQPEMDAAWAAAKAERIATSMRQIGTAAPPPAH